jgi:3-oxoadipate enol-lactonase
MIINLDCHRFFFGQSAPEPTAPHPMTQDFEYAVHGQQTGDWITLSHPIGSSLDVWAGQLQALSRQHPVLVYNTRGHGGDRRPETTCTVDDLAEDVLQLWQRLGITRSHFVGLSLGGCIGLAVAHHAPQRVQSLVVANARLDMDDGASAMWLQRARSVEQQGMAAIAAATLERWLTPEFVVGHPREVAQIRQTLLATSPQGFAACARALAAMHQQQRLAALQVPALFVTGLSDQAVPSAMVEHDARQNPHFRFAAIAGPHILNLENPSDFNQAILGFVDHP